MHARTHAIPCFLLGAVGCVSPWKCTYMWQWQCGSGSVAVLMHTPRLFGARVMDCAVLWFRYLLYCHSSTSHHITHSPTHPLTSHHSHPITRTEPSLHNDSASEHPETDDYLAGTYIQVSSSASPHQTRHDFQALNQTTPHHSPMDCSTKLQPGLAGICSLCNGETSHHVLIDRSNGLCLIRSVLQYVWRVGRDTPGCTTHSTSIRLSSLRS